MIYGIVWEIICRFIRDDCNEIVDVMCSRKCNDQIQNATKKKQTQIKHGKNEIWIGNVAYFVYDISNFVIFVAYLCGISVLGECRKYCSSQMHIILSSNHLFQLLNDSG